MTAEDNKAIVGRFYAEIDSSPVSTTRASMLLARSAVVTFWMMASGAGEVNSGFRLCASSAVTRWLSYLRSLRSRSPSPRGAPLRY
jgi:hypothetical protein